MVTGRGLPGHGLPRARGGGRGRHGAGRRLLAARAAHRLGWRPGRPGAGRRARAGAGRRGGAGRRRRLARRPARDGAAPHWAGRVPDRRGGGRMRAVVSVDLLTVAPVVAAAAGAAAVLVADAAGPRLRRTHLVLAVVA